MKRLMILALAGLFLMTAAGCAKKTAAPISSMTDTTPVVTDMPSRDISGIDEPSISGSAVMDDSAMGGSSDLYGAQGLARIQFDFDQYTLTAEARDTLAANAAYLKANPSKQIMIEGHCDERGSDEYNLALGEKRAAAARDYLVSLGVPANRMTIISYGEEIPLDPTSSEEAWAQNRRAEFKERN